MASGAVSVERDDHARRTRGLEQFRRRVGHGPPTFGADAECSPQEELRLSGVRHHDVGPKVLPRPEVVRIVLELDAIVNRATADALDATAEATTATVIGGP